MAHMRSRSAQCAKCGATCYFLADLDKGKIIRWTMPDSCMTQQRCGDNMVRGVFDHRFCEGALRPIRTC
jgi:hypothetical protein